MKHNIEPFYSDPYSFMGLKRSDYPVTHKSMFRDNSPISDKNLIGTMRGSGSKYCDDGKITIKRQKILPYMNPYTEKQSCQQTNRLVNRIFTVSPGKIMSKYIPEIKRKMNEKDEELNTTMKKETTFLIDQLAEMEDDIKFSQKFVSENNINYDNYKTRNKELGTELDTKLGDTHKSQQVILKQKEAVTILDGQIKYIHTITKYVLYVIAIVTLYYIAIKRMT